MTASAADAFSPSRPLQVGDLESDRPTARDLASIFLATFALRLAVFFTIVFGLHFSLKQYTHWADGKSYLRIARVMHGEEVPELREYDRRVFPGYPALIAGCMYLGLPADWSGLMISWTSSALAAVFGAMLFQDRRIGWGLATLTPQYVLNGAMVMTEAPALAFTLGGLLLADRAGGVVGGAIAGIAGLIRPMACFAVIGQLVSATFKNRLSRGLAFALAAAVVVGASVVIIHFTTGDALRGARIYATHEQAYRGRMFDWPFASIIRVISSRDVPWWKSAYIVGHLPIVLLGCGLLAWQIRRTGWRGDSRLALCAPWLWLNTLFALCVGSSWGFLVFQRLILMALPPLLFAFLPFTPRAGWVWRMAALGSWFTAVAAFQNV